MTPFLFKLVDSIRIYIAQTLIFAVFCAIFWVVHAFVDNLFAVLDISVTPYKSTSYS